MQTFSQGLIFFVIFGIFWYVILVKNVWEIGAHVASKKEAVINAVFTSAVATVIAVALPHLFNLFI